MELSDYIAGKAVKEIYTYNSMLTPTTKPTEIIHIPKKTGYKMVLSRVYVSSTPTDGVRIYVRRDSEELTPGGNGWDAASFIGLAEPFGIDIIIGEGRDASILYTYQGISTINLTLMVEVLFIK